MVFMNNTICAIVVALAPLSAFATDIADQVIAEMNLARTAPQQYAQIVANQTAGFRGKEGNGATREAVRFLEKASPLAPLAQSEGIRSSALSHVLEMGPVGGRGHVSHGGAQPWDRMARFGQWVGRAGENISYGKHDARGIVIQLIVDDGVRGRGHRKNIFNREFRVAGAASGFHATYGAMCVIDFAGAFVEAPGRVATRAAAPGAPL